MFRWDIGQELSPGTVGVHREAVAVPGGVPLTGIVSLPHCQARGASCVF